MKVGIIGASGYSGETLVKLLSRHPNVELSCITSRKLAGTPVEDAMPFLRGSLPGLSFVNSNPEELANSDVDLFFLALPHGVSFEYAVPLVKAGKKVIDLSADFRLGSPETYKEFYNEEHPAPDLMVKAPYVMPELSPIDSWKEANLIACPGCYPTSTLVPLIPLIRSGLIELEGIVVNSSSGVSGAGKKATETFSYCERNESASAYGAPKHRHLSEIEEQLSSAAGKDVIIQFTPHLSPMKAGIETTIVAKAKSDLDTLYKTWNESYPQESSPFVRILKSGTFPETKYVVGSNRVDMTAVHDPRTGNFVISSTIDNLIKGASGQAIQIMNLANGYEQNAGLV